MIFNPNAFRHTTNIMQHRRLRKDTHIANIGNNPRRLSEEEEERLFGIRLKMIQEAKRMMLYSDDFNKTLRAVIKDMLNETDRNDDAIVDHYVEIFRKIYDDEKGWFESRPQWLQSLLHFIAGFLLGGVVMWAILP